MKWRNSTDVILWVCVLWHHLKSTDEVILLFCCFRLFVQRKESIQNWSYKNKLRQKRKKQTVKRQKLRSLCQRRKLCESVFACGVVGNCKQKEIHFIDVCHNFVYQCYNMSLFRLIKFNSIVMSVKPLRNNNILWLDICNYYFLLMSSQHLFDICMYSWQVEMSF